MKELVSTAAVSFRHARAPFCFGVSFHSNFTSMPFLFFRCTSELHPVLTSSSLLLCRSAPCVTPLPVLFQLSRGSSHGFCLVFFEFL